MRSKNQEVDPLFAPFITKVFSAQRIFRVLRNSLFRTNDLKATFGQRQSCRPIFNFYAPMRDYLSRADLQKKSFFLENVDLAI